MKNCYFNKFFLQNFSTIIFFVFKIIIKYDKNDTKKEFLKLLIKKVRTKINLIGHCDEAKTFTLETTF